MRFYSKFTDIGSSWPEMSYCTLFVSFAEWWVIMFRIDRKISEDIGKFAEGTHVDLKWSSDMTDDIRSSQKYLYMLNGSGGSQKFSEIIRNHKEVTWNNPNITEVSRSKLLLASIYLKLFVISGKLLECDPIIAEVTRSLLSHLILYSMAHITFMIKDCYAVASTCIQEYILWGDENQRIPKKIKKYFKCFN